jgi:hypothetical protein
LTRIVVDTELDAPPSEVWAQLEHIDRHVEWMADAQEIRFTTSQRQGVGTRFTCVTGMGPVRLTDRMEVTEWEPERTMGVRHQGVVTGEGRFELVGVDGGRRTRFTWSEELRFPWWLGGAIGARLGGAAVLRRVWRGNLARLKRAVERGR